MSVETIAQIKSYFETGDKPTQTQFENLIDTLENVTISIETVTQITSKTTSVGINGEVGVISLVSVGLSTNQGFEFTVNNSSVTASSMILATLETDDNIGFVINTKTIGAGSFIVDIMNASSLYSTLGAIMKVHFRVYN